MSRPEIHLISKLTATTAVTTLVSARIWPMYRRSDTLPCVVYGMTSEQPVNDAGAGAPDNYQTRLSVECYATTYAGAKALGAAVAAALAGYTDTDGAIYHLDSRRDDLGELQQGETIVNCHIEVQDYVVHWTTS